MRLGRKTYPMKSFDIFVMWFRSDLGLTHSQSQASHTSRTSADGTQDKKSLFNTETSMQYMTGE